MCNVYATAWIKDERRVQSHKWLFGNFITDAASTWIVKINALVQSFSTTYWSKTKMASDSKVRPEQNHVSEVMNHIYPFCSYLIQHVYSRRKKWQLWIIRINLFQFLMLSLSFYNDFEPLAFCFTFPDIEISWDIRREYLNWKVWTFLLIWKLTFGY